jgi:hypothetical protein
MEIAVTTVKQNKDSAVKQRIQDIQMLISWREIAHTYFGKSASWLYHKLDGIDGNGGVGGFTEEEKMMYEAMSFFRQGSGAWFQRVVPEDVEYGGIMVQNKLVAGVRTLGISPLTAENPQDVDMLTAGGATTVDDNLFYLYSWGPGGYSKNIRIEVSSNNLIEPELNAAQSIAITPVGQSSLLAPATYNYVVTAMDRRSTDAMKVLA